MVTIIGVDWPNAIDAEKRYHVMLDGINLVNAKTCLDFGAGLAHFYEFLIRKNENRLTYEGLELSKKMTSHVKLKFPHLNLHSHDVLSDGWQMGMFDCIVMNGVFTEKLELSYEEMFLYFENLLSLAYVNLQD